MSSVLCQIVIHFQGINRRYEVAQDIILTTMDIIEYAILALATPLFPKLCFSGR